MEADEASLKYFSGFLDEDQAKGYMAEMKAEDALAKENAVDTPAPAPDTPRKENVSEAPLTSALKNSKKSVRRSGRKKSMSCRGSNV